MKYLLLLLTVLTLTGCTVREQIVYRNIYIESACPKLRVIDRPVLSNVDVVFVGDTAEVTIEQVRELYTNQRKLMSVIRAYEKYIAVYNAE